jgi:hypothetical protein
MPACPVGPADRTGVVIFFECLDLERKSSLINRLIYGTVIFMRPSIFIEILRKILPYVNSPLVVNFVLFVANIFGSGPSASLRLAGGRACLA